MPARRCGDCHANWIDMPAFWHCPGCGKQTTYTPGMPNRDLADADRARAERIRKAGTTPPKVERPDNSVVVHEAAGTQKTDARGHRVERYLTLGFEPDDAELLADAHAFEVDSQGREWRLPLYWRKVEAALAAGCSHHHALLIFA